MSPSLEINTVVWTYCVLKSLNKTLWVTVPFSGGTCELYVLFWLFRCYASFL